MCSGSSYISCCVRQRFLQTQVGLARGTATPWQLKGALPEPLLVFPLREPQPAAAAAAACLPAGDRLPEFCCSAGLLTRIDPGLEVPRAGLDRLTLPLEEGQAAALLEALEGKRVGLFRKVQVQNPSEPEGLLLHLRNGGMDAPAGGSPQWLPGGMCAMLLQDCNVPPLTREERALPAAAAGWEAEVVAEAVRHTKAALCILPETGECSRQLSGAGACRQARTLPEAPDLARAPAGLHAVVEARLHGLLLAETGGGLKVSS